VKYIWSTQELLDGVRAEEGTGTKWHFFFFGEHSTGNVVDIDPQGIRLHVHQAHDEIIQVLQGKATMQIGDDLHEIKEGDLVCIPKGTPHCPRGQVTLLSIYAPEWDKDNPDRVFVE